MCRGMIANIHDSRMLCNPPRMTLYSHNTPMRKEGHKNYPYNYHHFLILLKEM